MKLQCKQKRKIFANCIRISTDEPIVLNCVYTPKEVYELSSQGMSVQLPNVPLYDGDAKPTWDVPLHKQKRVDPADLYQLQVQTRKKITNSYNNYKNSKNKKND